MHIMSILIKVYILGDIHTTIQQVCFKKFRFLFLFLLFYEMLGIIPQNHCTCCPVHAHFRWSHQTLIDLTRLWQSICGLEVQKRISWIFPWMPSEKSNVHEVPVLTFPFTVRLLKYIIFELYIKKVTLNWNGKYT